MVVVTVFIGMLDPVAGVIVFHEELGHHPVNIAVLATTILNELYPQIPVLSLGSVRNSPE